MGRRGRRRYFGRSTTGIDQRGEYALTHLHWNDASKALTIDSRNGSYPGMTKKRTFKVVVVGSLEGHGAEFANRTSNIAIYEGRAMTVETVKR